MTEYATVDNRPPLYGEEFGLHRDKGQGIPNLTKNNMTIEDIYKSPFALFDAHLQDYNGQAKDAMKSLQCHSDLSRMFYSEKNMARIQKALKDEVRRRTKGQFKLETDQDPGDIKHVMTAVFTQYARHRPGEVVRQIKFLNAKVVELAVPDMITVIKQAYGYMIDISRPLQPNRLPVNVNSRGRNTLPSITTTFGF